MVFKIEKTKNYTVMSNYHLRDQNLSFKAKGLLSFMLSLPENWDYSLNGLVAVSKESIKAIRNILKELKENGYLVIEQDRGDKGYYKYNYIIYEVPIDRIKDKNNPDSQKGYTDEGYTEKDIQTSTNEINTDKQDKLDKINSITKSLIKNKFIDETSLDLYRYDELFNELLKNHSYQNMYMFVNYILSKWKESKGLDEEGNKIKNKFSYFKNAILNNINKLENNELEWDSELEYFFENEDDDKIFDEDLEYEIE